MAFPALSVSREFAADRINAVCNHPDVRPWLGGGDGPIDLTPLVANPANYLMMGQGGGVLFQCLEPGLYEAHTQFLPDARGPAAVQAVKDALRFLFTRTDAVEIVTKVPEGNKGALGLVRAIHGQLQFTRENVWPIGNQMVAVGHYALPIMAWAGKADGLAQSGEFFHQKLTEAKELGGSSHAPHPDDNSHDQYVGATVEMIQAGQVAKAISFYNRWAIFSGYGRVSCISISPVMLDIQDAILLVNGDDFNVVFCR